MNKKKLVENLNQDLAGELGAIIQYITYAAKVTGPYRPQLTAFFLEEVPDEQMHAQYLANKIVALGGEPTTTPRPVPEAATNREMVEAVWKRNARRFGIIHSGPKKRMRLAIRVWSYSLKIL